MISKCFQFLFSQSRRFKKAMPIVYITPFCDAFTVKNIHTRLTLQIGVFTQTLTFGAFFTLERQSYQNVKRTCWLSHSTSVFNCDRWMQVIYNGKILVVTCQFSYTLVGKYSSGSAVILSQARSEADPGNR